MRATLLLRRALSSFARRPGSRTMSSSSSAGTLINLEQYPIDKPDSKAYKALVFEARKSLSELGCCQLPDFITREGVQTMQRECLPLAERVKGNQSERRNNVYYSPQDPSLGKDHPVNRTFSRQFGVIRNDMISGDAAVRAVYNDVRVVRLAADILEAPLYQSNDAYQALTVNVMADGEDLHWHFDCNACAITLGIQQPDSGGELEYVQDIGRENVKDIMGVIDGKGGPPTRHYDTSPGELIFFRGGQSMHRVRTVQGSRMRLVAALQLHTAPDAADDPLTTQRIYGVDPNDHLGPVEHVVSSKGSFTT